jgi:RNA polymerase sigma factor (sigma-70 family)
LKPLDTKYLVLFHFCEQLVTGFDKNWFTRIFNQDDLVQELFLHFSSRVSDENPTPPIALARKVAKDKLIDLLRRESRNEILASPDDRLARLRTASSRLNSDDEFKLFLEQLTKDEKRIFGYFLGKDYVNAKYKEIDMRMLKGDFGKPEVPETDQKSITQEIADFLGISTSAAAQRLSRLRAKYFIFREKINDSNGFSVTLFDAILDKVRSDGLCDGKGWVTPAAASRLIDESTIKITEKCAHGHLDAFRAARDEKNEWFINPVELARWLREGDRRTMDFGTAMTVGWIMGVGQLERTGTDKRWIYMRRAGWNSLRGLILKWSDDDDYNMEHSPPVVDCRFKNRHRCSVVSSTEFVPTPEDRGAVDWVEYDATKRDEKDGLFVDWTIFL